MPGSITSWLTYNRSPRACGQATSLRLAALVRYASGSHSSPRTSDAGANGAGSGHGESQPKGAMTQRLEQMTEESLETGDRGARKAVQEAGFSEDLKAQLETKLADASFKSVHAQAFAQTNMPAMAPKHARDIAAAMPWSGLESVEDASLRMLDDAHKPLRTASKGSVTRGGPAQVDAGRSRSKPSSGTRLAIARDRASLYSHSNEEQKGLTDEEREKFRQELRARFSTGHRAVAASIQGLTSLANQRIEDAVARGQFKNLPRGQKIERDHNANSPFINTTEYFMNKMIKKQDIVPPWIEKQQEVTSTATAFRKRLRSDWRRHASRAISSRGGSLEQQMNLAAQYAFAECQENPSKEQVEKNTAIDQHGHMSQITVAGQLKATTKVDTTILENEIEILEQMFNDDGSLKAPEEQITITSQPPSPAQQPPSEAPRQPSVPPFRDPQWEKTERSYHELVIKQLNDLTRSYNLMAPNLARKPYFNLERELRSAYADVAPQIASAIRDRALAPKIKSVEAVAHKAGSVLDKFAMGKASQVYDETKPQYGFKEFWRDLFTSKS